MTDNLQYLVAAYSVVWLILAFYLFILLKRNRRLQEMVTRLESRMSDLENGEKPEP